MACQSKGYWFFDDSNYKHFNEAISLNQLDNKLINIFGEHAKYIYNKIGDKQSTNVYKVVLHIYQAKHRILPLLDLIACERNISIGTSLFRNYAHTYTLSKADIQNKDLIAIDKGINKQEIVGVTISFDFNDIESDRLSLFVSECETLFCNNRYHESSIAAALGPLSKCSIQNKDISKSYDALIKTIHSQSQYVPLNISQVIAMFVYGDFSMRHKANIRVIDDAAKTSKIYQLDIFPNVYTTKEIFAILCDYDCIHIEHGNRRVPEWEVFSESPSDDGSQASYVTERRWMFYYKSKEEDIERKLDQNVYLREMDISFDDSILIAKPEYRSYVQDV
eukprot:443795_1